MKIECNAKKLLAAIRRVMPAVMSAGMAKHRPLLSCVRLCGADDALHVAGTNVELWISAKLEAAVARAGVVAVSAEKLAATLAELGNDEVTISATNSAATLSATALRFEFPTFDANDFPCGPEDDGSPGFDLGAESLRTLIRRTNFACDRAESNRKYTTVGAVIDVRDGVASMVATDTKRVGLAMEAAAPGYCLPDFGDKPPIIPFKTLQAVEKALEDGETVRVHLERNSVKFTAPTWTLYSSVIAGRFPPYRKLFNIDTTSRISVNAAEFASAVRRAAVMTDQESLRVDFDFKPAAVSLQARGAKVGSSEVTLPLPGFDGPEFATAFDPHYLLEWLKAVGADATVCIELATPGKPVLFRLGDSAHYLVMPLTA
jgi:DNA polymerase-3 subunit beta